MKYPGTESATLAFKGAVPKNDQIIKTIIGFCNQNGGRLVLGVGDDGSVLGLPEGEVTTLIESLDKMVYQASSPPIMPRVSSQRIGEKTIVIVDVSAGMNPPYFLQAKGLERGTYIRLGKSTLRADGDTIQELQWQARGRFYDELPIHSAFVNDLDQQQIVAFLKGRKKSAKAIASKEVMSAYQLAMEEHGHIYPTVAGLLLFGRNPGAIFPESFIICTQFRGTSGRDVLATQDCEGTLFDQYQQAYDFIISRLYVGFVIKGPKREDRLEVPEEALREILINAIVHRNYHIPAPIKVAIYDDRIEVFSPGTFPGPLDVHELTLGITYIRNRVITKVFREAGYVEKLGSGFITLFKSYQAYQLKTPHVIEGPNFVKCVLPRTPATEEISKEDGVLELLRSMESISIGDLMRYEKISRSTANRRLSRLVKRGLIKKVGTGRNTYYTKP